MEGQDAASAVGKEGAAEEDGVVSASALAKEAAVLFQNRRYAEGVDILKQLLLKKQDDPKVRDLIPFGTMGILCCCSSF